MKICKTPGTTIRRTFIQSALVAAFAGAMLAPAATMAADAGNQAYWVNSSGTNWKSITGLCWRAGTWTPAMANAECDPDLLPKAEAAPVVVAAAPAPAPAPRTVSRKVSFSAEELFAFDKAVLRPEGKEALDKLASDVTSASYDVVIVTGHTDRIGTEQYNQKLSERRANAVRSYLIGKNIPADRITAQGKGETQPVTKPEDCKGPLSKKLIACLQPDRRVEVEVTGTKEVTSGM